MRCNERIQLDKPGQQETYCQRKRGHDGEHSVKINPNDPFAPDPADVQLVLSLRPAPAVHEPNRMPSLSNPDGTNPGRPKSADESGSKD
jgi:hypothetical protein